MKYIMMLASVLFVAGCSTTKDSGDNKLVDIYNSKDEKVPEWFIKKPKDTLNEFYVVATDVSKDAQFAIDKATLNAKIQIAERLSTKVESVTRETVNESGFGNKDVSREVDRITRAKVNQEIGFFTRENLSIIKEGNMYRAFVLFKMNVEEARRLTFKEDKTLREDKFKALD